MLRDALFHHVGIAAESIEKTVALFVEAGYSIKDTVFDPKQNVRISFLQKEGNSLLELVEPADNNSSVGNIVKKVGVSAYHFCYEVDSLDYSIAQLRHMKYILLVKPEQDTAYSELINSAKFANCLVRLSLYYELTQKDVE